MYTVGNSWSAPSSEEKNRNTALSDELIAFRHHSNCAKYLCQTMDTFAPGLPGAMPALVQMQAEQLRMFLSAEEMRLQEMAGQKEGPKLQGLLVALGGLLGEIDKESLSKEEYLPQVVAVLVEAHSLSLPVTTMVVQQVAEQAKELRKMDNDAMTLDGRARTHPGKA